jgi:hypothetical protein
MCQDPQEAMLKVSGFKSESRPASRRNAVRLQIGISVRLRRNLQRAKGRPVSRKLAIPNIAPTIMTISVRGRAE